MNHQSFGKRDKTTADEFDAFTGWRRCFTWKAGDLRRIKKARHKRERRDARLQVKRGDA